jgi:hypothetical protein
MWLDALSLFDPAGAAISLIRLINGENRAECNLDSARRGPEKRSSPGLANAA